MTQKAKILHGFNGKLIHLARSARRVSDFAVGNVKNPIFTLHLNTSCYPEQLKNSNNNVQSDLQEFVVDLGLVDLWLVHRLIAWRVLICTPLSLCYSAIPGEFSKETQHRDIRSHQRDALTLLNGGMDS